MKFWLCIIRDAGFFRAKFDSEVSQPSCLQLVSCFFLNPEFRLVFWFRAYSSLYKGRLKFLGLFLYQVIKRKYSSDIHPSATIGVPFKIGHHMNIVIGPKVVIGNGVYLFNGVTLGNKNVGEDDAMPEVGDEVILGTGAKILGPVKVGSRSIVGANSLIIKDVGCDEKWGGVPAKKIGER